MNRSNIAGLVTILVLFLALGAIYSVVTPAFEASDELSHYAFIQHLAAGRGLPVQEPGKDTEWKQEGSQPPLYYLIMAGITSGIDTRDFSAVRHNPHALIGIPNSVGNKNMILHTGADGWPYRGSVLAVNLIRWASLLLQCATVVFAFLIGRELFPARSRLPLLAAALVAFNPMFLFISASANNDNLVVPLCSAGLWLTMVALRRGFTWPRVAVLGLVCGLAALSKVSGLALSALVVLAAALAAVRRRKPFPVWRAALSVVVGVGLVAGWWFVRNLRLYGDPLGLNVMVQIAGARAAPQGLGAMVGEFQGFFMSYWGVFGGFDVLAQPWVYVLFSALTAVAVVGFVFAVLRKRLELRAQHALLAAWLILLSISLLRWTSMTLASQGRLLFPGIGAAAGLLAAGLVTWISPRMRGWVAGGWAGLALAAAVSTPFLAIAPAYAQTPLMSEQEIPADIRPLQVNFERKMFLIGYRLEPRALTKGGRLWVTLYWKALAPMATDYSVFVQLFDSAHRKIGALDTYPGLGTRPTSSLSPGGTFADRYAVDIFGEITKLSACDVEVGLYDLATMTGLSARDPSGQKVGRVVLSGAKLVPDRAVDYLPQTNTQFQVDGKVALVGFDVEPELAHPGDEVALTLYWQVERPLGADYVVFVHMLGGGPPIAQADGVPMAGGYPTSLWDPGETIADRHVFALPRDVRPGTYDFGVGLYRPEDGIRLVVSRVGGPAVPNDMAVLPGSIRIVPP